MSSKPAWATQQDPVSKTTHMHVHSHTHTHTHTHTHSLSQSSTKKKTIKHKNCGKILDVFEMPNREGVEMWKIFEEMLC
jgi:hypothetical protein